MPHPDAGEATYHWGPNKSLAVHILVNIISINGSTCVSFSSTTMRKPQLDKLIAADSAEDAQVGRDGGGDTGAGVAEKKNPSGATDCSEPNEKDERGI